MRDKRVFSDTQADLSALSVYLGPFYVPTPTSHIRVEAAFELARAIVESVRAGAEPASPDQLGLSL